jgi:hypothetical protein
MIWGNQNARFHHKSDWYGKNQYKIDYGVIRNASNKWIMEHIWLIIHCEAYDIWIEDEEKVS